MQLLFAYLAPIIALLVFKLVCPLIRQRKRAAEQQPVISSLLDFLFIVGQLKTTKRTGWVQQKLILPESISDHMHRMGIMALAIRDPAINKDRCVKMAIVHDLVEAICGDITPEGSSGVPKLKKQIIEQKAMDQIVETLGPRTAAAVEIAELWQEYERAQTPEAKLVKEFDKFEMIVQAYEYERDQHRNLQQFWESTNAKFSHPVMLALVKELYERRAKLPLHRDS